MLWEIESFHIKKMVLLFLLSFNLFYINLNQNIAHKLIHLLVYASNAASVFIGQAYDAHQPELITYDFDGSFMVPGLFIKSGHYGCHI